MADTLYEALNITSENEDNVIIPGTTPRLVVTIDDELMDTTVAVRIDVVQNGATIDQVRDCEIQGHKVMYTFSQEETYRMKPGKVEMQLHGLTSEEAAWKTGVFTLSVGDSLTGTMIQL